VHHRSDEAAERNRCRQAGTITQILVENGQPVEFGQPLFVIG
jgi:biotin carboxyl carrier protein